jgi:ketosteroid isomerase-like protein
MKKMICLALLSLVCMSAMAQSADEAGVSAAVQRLDAAMLAADADGMKAVTSDALSYGHSNGAVQDQKVFIETIVSGGTKYRRIDLSNTKTTLAGDDAIVRDHFSGTVESGGKVSEVDLEQLMVWQKRDGVWKLIARQGYKH